MNVIKIHDRKFSKNFVLKGNNVHFTPVWPYKSNSVLSFIPSPLFVLSTFEEKHHVDTFIMESTVDLKSRVEI